MVWAYPLPLILSRVVSSTKIISCERNDWMASVLGVSTGTSQTQARAAMIREPASLVATSDPYPHIAYSQSNIVHDPLCEGMSEVSR